MTLKSVPIHDLPDLSFTYGLARTYNKKLKLVNEMSFPMQGVLFAAERKLLMFSTPYKSQKLMMQFTSTPAASSPSAAPTATPSSATDVTPDAPSASSVELLSSEGKVVSGRHAQGDSATTTTTRSYDLMRTDSEGIAFRIQRSNNEEPGSVSQLKFFVWDTAIAKFNATHWHNNDTRTITLGESQLSVRFHYFQSTRPPMTLPIPSAVLGLHGSTYLRSAAMSVSEQQSSGDENTVSPSANHIQTPASLASDCFYALDLDLADSDLNVARVIPSATAAVPHVEGETVHAATTAVEEEEEASWTRRLTSFIPAAKNVSILVFVFPRTC